MGHLYNYIRIIIYPISLSFKTYTGFRTQKGSAIYLAPLENFVGLSALLMSPQHYTHAVACQSNPLNNITSHRLSTFVFTRTEVQSELTVLKLLLGGGLTYNQAQIDFTTGNPF